MAMAMKRKSREKMKKINFSLTLTIILIIITFAVLTGCKWKWVLPNQEKNCPPGYGGTYWYVDVSKLPFELNETNQFAYAGRNGIDYEDNVTKILRQYSIGEVGWFTYCNTTEHYSLFTIDDVAGARDVNQEDFKKVVKEQNASCNGCIKEIIVAMYY